MTQPNSSPLAGDTMKKAVQAFSELLEEFPQKSRNELLIEIQLKFDLSPLECEFLNTHFSGTG